MAKHETQQTDYRAERKKRLAKAAKAHKKSKVDSVVVTTWVIRIACVLIALAAVAFALYQFGVPHKVFPALTVGDRTYSVAEYSYFYTNAYQKVVQQSQQQQSSSDLSSLLGNLGSTGFDSTKDASLQFTTDESGAKISYDELFRRTATKQIEMTEYYLDLCAANGETLTEENKLAIDEHMLQIASTTANSGYSVSRYISLIYGKGMNEKLLRSLLEDQYLVSQYVERIEKDFYDNLTDDELDAALKDHLDEFESVDLRLFGFEIAKFETEDKEDTEEATSNETTTEEPTTETPSVEENEPSTDNSEESNEEEKTPSKTEILAQQMCDKITDAQSFIDLAYEYCAEDDKDTFKKDGATLAKGIKRSAVTSNIGKELADWLYSSERNIGDKRIYTTDKYVYVVYILATNYIEEDHLVDARHILISFEEVAKELNSKDGNTINTEKKDDVEIKTDTTEDGKEITNDGTGYSIELVTEAYKQAKTIYEMYLKEGKDKNEEYFAELAELNSHDTGSVGENTLGGGLYEGIEKGKMVEPFENWVYDESREEGDIEIIMTEYGWHIMYFVKEHDEPAWKASARDLAGAEKFEAYSKEVETAIANSSSEATFYKFAGNESLKTISPKQ